MKNATYTCFLFLLSTSVISQTITTKSNQLTKNNDFSISSPIVALPMAADRQAIIWSDDFSMPANWTTNSPIGSGVMKDWVIGTTIPAGAFPILPINSITKANGYALFDSDKNCSGSQVANITTANSINCSANSFVRLQFQQQYRRFYDSTFVFVSNNGTSWVKYAVNINLSPNDYCSTNPDFVKIDISATAGSQATVWIRFQFYSPASLNSLAGCGYAWMIDDVSISDISANDIAIDRPYSDFGYKDGGYYTQIPKTQVVPINFRAAVSNQGSTSQSNVQLNVDISNGTSSVYSQTSSSIPAFPYRATDTLSVTSAFTPPVQTASYITKFKISQTQTELTADTLNNTMVHNFMVTDTIYARDNGIITGVTGPNYFTNGEEDGSEIANVFDFPVDARPSSVSVFLHSTTSLSTAIQAKIYVVDLTGNFIEVSQSGVYNITSAANIGKWVTLPISDVVLNAGMNYLASIVTTGVALNGPKVVIGADFVTKQPSQTTFVYLSLTSKWVYVTDLPMIRLNIKPGYVGIDEVLQREGIKLFQNQPNPFNNTSVITYELAKTSKVSLDIYDITGRKLVSINEGNKVEGTHSLSIDAKQFSQGVYFYSLKVDEASLTKRMVISE